MIKILNPVRSDLPALRSQPLGQARVDEQVPDDVVAGLGRVGVVGRQELAGRLGSVCPLP